MRKTTTALAIIVAPKAPRKKLLARPIPEQTQARLKQLCHGLLLRALLSGRLLLRLLWSNFRVWNRDGSLMAATERHDARNALMPPLQGAVCGSGRMRILPGEQGGRAGRAWVR